ncbi:MAG: metal-sulfur cluster biosynthetic enzyme [Candidatus Fermentibacteria bacterium]|nr:metal-sulfur cluster biosynthetic enzyme [Candidatus Fermentibacteria bacterium]
MESEKNISEIIESVEHPAIALSLKKLGLIKSYEISGNNVNIVMAFPALNIPILDMLIQRVQQPLEAMDVQVDIEKIVMTQQELQSFLNMEQSAWKGLES